jgi:integrating conjugative element protein (TIGR03749 family)
VHFAAAAFVIPATGLLPATVRAIEVIHWERVPLVVALHVGQERILFVDRPMRVAVPNAIAEHLRVQSADGAIYLRANAPFASARLELQDVDTGVLVLLDVKATELKDGEILEPMRILVGKHTGSESASEPNADSHSDPSELAPPAPTPTAVLLTRYAAQSLYAPRRTLEPVPGIVPTPVHRMVDLTTLLPALPVTVTLLAAWRLQDHWVTALRLTNLTPTWLRLDPRALQGDFRAATFQHRDLGPQGQSADTTVLYVVTQGHGLAESLLPAISPVDAAANLSAPQPAAPHHEK